MKISDSEFDHLDLLKDQLLSEIHYFFIFQHDAFFDLLSYLINPNTNSNKTNKSEDNNIGCAN